MWVRWIIGCHKAALVWRQHELFRTYRWQNNIALVSRYRSSWISCFKCVTLCEFTLTGSLLHEEEATSIELEIFSNSEGRSETLETSLLGKIRKYKMSINIFIFLLIFITPLNATIFTFGSNFSNTTMYLNGVANISSTGALQLNFGGQNEAASAYYYLKVHKISNLFVTL